MTEITLKPNWDKAPEWAKWWAVDESGAHYWFENKPIISISDTMWLRGEDDDGKLLVAYDGDWKNSLQERPVPNPSKSQQLPFIVPPPPDLTPPDTTLLIACSDKYLNDLLETVKRIEKLLQPMLVTTAMDGVRPPEM